VTKEWKMAQPKCREQMLIEPVTNLDYEYSKRGENEYFRSWFFVEPGGDESPKKGNKMGENDAIADGLTKK
jgi:hypothetical protein